ncbi:AI-2E family transporter [Pseudogracilibacillus sp. SE30717A]|uniref:AI-2E family transporter n=1 Tax=Pseudogracilibacillus sp. SE30717A TaxID=3098293 RepID=UPI00300E31B5
MKVQKKTIYISLCIILIIILLYLLVKLFPIYKIVLFFIGRIIAPFLIAAFISYLLYPIILKLNQFKISKGFAVLIIYFLFFTSVTLLFYKSFPVFVHQLQDLSEHLPQFVYMYEEIIYSLYESTSFLPEIVHDKMDELIVRIETSVEKQIENILERVANLFDFIITITIIPVLVFYFLKDFTLMKSSLQKIIPPKQFSKFETILLAIDESLGGYVRGQLIISSAVMFIAYVVFHTFQLKYGLVLAVIMGLMNLIPYFGPIIGTVPAVAVAMTVSWKLVIVVLVTTVIVQTLENSFLSPYVMGKNVKIHPVFIILTLIVGAEVGGIIGMILAVPTITILKAIIVQIYLNRLHCD